MASIGRIVSVPLLFGLLLLIYTYVPGGRRTPRSQLPGTIFATAGWLVFSRVFSFYILHFWRLSYIYGSLTAVILIILWLYVIINLLFIGAGINAEMNGKQSNDRGGMRVCRPTAHRIVRCRAGCLHPAAVFRCLP